MKQGNKTWLAGHLRATSKIYDKETHIYKQLSAHYDKVKDGSMADVAVVDLIEIFAGRARVSELAPQFGLSASQPFDKIFDIDLKTKKGVDLLKGAVRRLRPLLLLIAWPCAFWSLFNENMNFASSLEVLEALREDEMSLVDQFGPEPA